MKKQLLTMLLMMVGMTSLAQSGWSNPSGNYQEQTVVYVTVDCGDYDIYSGVTEPQVAAFIGGEIRALATSYQSLGNYKVYTLRVGGTSDDNDNVIDFKFYDPVSGLIYPLGMTDEQYEAAEITYQGDYTYQEDQSIKLFIGSATPANEMRFTYYDVELGSIFMNVGDVMTIEDGGSIEYLFVSPTNAEEIPATTPEATLEWDLSSYDNSGNQASHYVSIEENVITALNSTPYGINVTARAGSLEMPVKILIYQPVTEIAIEDADIYLGVGRFVPDVVYNGGDSYPTTPGVTFSVESEEVVRIVDGITIVPVAKGSVTVTAVADDNPEVTTTFQVNVLSALQEFTYKGEIEFTIYDENSKDMMGSVNLPIFHWVYDDSGAPVIEPNEEYTVASEDESVVLVEYDDTGTKLVAVTAVKKGETNLVFTSKYDPTMSVEVRTVIRQAVYGVNFLTVNGEDVSGAETRPMADVYVGETVTVVAELNPADADYTDFSFRFVTSDGMEIPTETIGVEVVSTKISGGQCIMDFVFSAIPGVEVCIEAQADGVRSDNVLLNVYNRVENIYVSLLDEYWIDSDGDIFEFKYSVEPGNVKNEEFTVESSNPSVAEIIKSMDAGVYQLHAYAPGEVTFTFKSDENPDVAVEYSTVIKRTPTGVKITSIAGQVIEEGSNGVQVAVGQTVEAVAAVDPSDATIESFEMSIVNGDGIPVGDAEVEIAEVTLNDARTECRITFRFVTVPQDRVFVKAAVNETITDQVNLLVVQSVNEIQLSETEKTIWLGNEQIDFSITAIALPEDATNKNITVEVDDNVIVEYLGVGETSDVHNFRTMNKGTATITFTSEDNPSVVAKCVVNVKRKVTEISFDGFNEPLYNDGVAREVALTFWPEDADFDASALSVRIESTQFSFPGHWSVVEVEQGEVSGNSVAFEFTPKALCQNSNVIFEYDAAAVEGGSEMLTTSGMVSVMEKLTLGGGWSWISLTSAMFAPEAIKDGFVEARSRTDLVFNDVKWGPFGSLTMFDQTQAYKIKMQDDIDPVTVYATLEGVMNYDGAIGSKEFIKGWNWVSYPYEYRYPVEDIFNVANFAEGDIILSKNDGFVTLTDGAWVGTLIELLPNEGYMIYTANAFTCEMPNRFSLEQGEFEASAGTEIPAPAGAAARERSVWVYDGSKFANSMAVIAKVEIENCEDYTIGAFVGDECRGEGRFINGLAFISVAGEADENVTFRLYNKYTGEFVDVDRELQFSGMAGSVKVPVTMGTIEGTTGIDEVKGENGNVKTIYDISGRKVEQMTEGIYVIKVREGDKIVTKKVRK